MKDVLLQNALGHRLTKAEALEWLGNGGMVFVWPKHHPESATHVGLYIRQGGTVDVEMCGYSRVREAMVRVDIDEAFTIAAAYVRGAQK